MVCAHAMGVSTPFIAERSGARPLAVPCWPWQRTQPLDANRRSPRVASPGSSTYRAVYRKANTLATSSWSRSGYLTPLARMLSHIVGAWFHMALTIWLMPDCGDRLKPKSGADLPPTPFTGWQPAQPFFSKNSMAPSCGSPTRKLLHRTDEFL